MAGRERKQSAGKDGSRKDESRTSGFNCCCEEMETMLKMMQDFRHGESASSDCEQKWQQMCGNASSKTGK